MSWQPSGWTPGGWSPSWQPSTPPQGGGDGGFYLPPVDFGPTAPGETTPYVPAPPPSGYVDPRNYGPPGPAIPGNFPAPGVFSTPSFAGIGRSFRDARRGFSDNFGGTRGRVGGLLGSAIAGPVGGLLGSFVANLFGRNSGEPIEMPMSSSDYFAELYGTDQPASNFHSQRSGTRFVQGEIDPSGLPMDRSAHQYMPPVFAGDRTSVQGNVTYQETM